MKLNKYVGVAILFIGIAASAQVTVDKMTCAQAQAYAAKYGRYYVDGGADGPLLIYPATTFEKISCKGKTVVTPDVRRTIDDSQCTVSWYCNPY